MKCTKCGKEMREGQEQVGLENGVAIYNTFAYCDECKQKVNLDSLKKNKESKKHSTLSIWACVLSLFGCTSFIAFILALVDLCKNDKSKKHVGSWFALIICALYLLVFVPNLAGTEEKEPQKIGHIETESTMENNELNSTENEEKMMKKGEIAELNGVQVTLIDYEESQGGEYNKPSDGNIFVLSEFEIVNNTEKEISVSSIMSFDAYADDYALNFSFSALMEKEGSQLDGTIASGKKMKGWIGWEVPADYQNVEIHFTDNIWSSNKFVFVIEK